ncbi:DUF3558 domain-containing protein [Nocardia sp. NPDC057227]|uniref:DUF3558 domain-containing protein n=1 Tax=Nocardia sp. NPDC057227 TaxID=3346056 RepID=UPI00363E87E4
MRRAGVIAGALAVACLSAGCGPTVEEVAPESSVVVTVAPSTKADPDAGLWDPCGLPDSAISATGLDPGSKVPDVGGVDFDGWKVCSWQGSTGWYSLAVLSGEPTLQEVRSRTDFVGFTDRTVGSRPAVQFRDAGDDRGLTCSISVEVPEGSVMFTLNTRYSVGKQGDPCTEVRRHADDLAVHLP